MNGRLDIETQALHSETRRVARVSARGRELRLDVSNGRLEVWANRFEETEPELLDFLDALPADAVYFDVGASIGHFALYAALRVKTVVAFEPEALNFAAASLNHFLNRDGVVGAFSVFNVAVSDTRGMNHLAIGLYGAGEHTKSLAGRVRTDTAGEAHRQPVLTLPLDELVEGFGLPRPTHLKIDVDGAEARVLAGAAGLLADPRLAQVFIELEDGDLARDCTARLTGAGFRLAASHPVRRLSGGVYPGLTNCVFAR